MATARPPSARKAEPPTPARSARAPAARAPAELSAADGQRVAGLLERLRRQRVLDEARFSDLVVVWPPQTAAAGSAERTTLAAIDGGSPGAAVAALAGAAGLPRRKPARLEVLKRIDDTLVMKANAPALLAMRAQSPGLRVAPAAWAYAQYIRPLGDELESAALQVAPGAKVKRFELRFADPDGRPVAGVRVKALVDWEGAHVAALTDARGLARIAIPLLYPRVEMLLVEPEHTHWSVYVAGFKRVAAPARVEVRARPLVPDAFRLLGHYAPYEDDAGEGVTVGVIDSGVGPHRALRVAGGACLVTGEKPDDFADNGIGHGTHVAGTIAAARLGDTQVYGLAPRCRLLAYRVCAKTGDKGRAKSADIAAAIDRAIADGCDLVNISMGSIEAMPEVPDLLEKARNAGMVVFAATGNDGQPSLRYPARYSHAMAVGALGRDATFPEDCPESFQESEIRRGKEFVAEFSNHGLATDFIGPGVAVLSTFPGDRYAMMSGTSMATPFTCGMAARLLARSAALRAMPRGPSRADAIVQMLSASARKVGWAAEYEGFGVLAGGAA